MLLRALPPCLLAVAWATSAAAEPDVAPAAPAKAHAPAVGPAPAVVPAADAASEAPTEAGAPDAEPAPSPDGSTSEAAPTPTESEAKDESTRRGSRPGIAREWARGHLLQLHRLWQLRDFIETTPLVIGGVTLHLEAEPMVRRRLTRDKSKLTVAVAHDRVVVLGVF